MATNSQPFSLRPWPTGDRKPKNLAEFVTRVSAERGGFRNVTEEILRTEIEEHENGTLDVDADLECDDEDPSGSVAMQDIVAARDEVTKYIG